MSDKDKHEHDIFYNNKKLSVEEKKELLIDAKNKSYDIQTDILDCNVSWSRQHIDISFDDILKKISDGSHFVVINRKGYESWKNTEYFKTSWCLEIGFSTMQSPSYFLFIYVKEDELEFFINKYNLEIN